MITVKSTELEIARMRDIHPHRLTVETASGENLIPSSVVTKRDKVENLTLRPQLAQGFSQFTVHVLTCPTFPALWDDERVVDR